MRIEMDVTNPQLKEWLTGSPAESSLSPESYFDENIEAIMRHVFLENNQVLKEKDESLDDYRQKVKAALGVIFGANEDALQSFYAGFHRGARGWEWGTSNQVLETCLSREEGGMLRLLQDRWTVNLTKKPKLVLLDYRAPLKALGFLDGKPHLEPPSDAVDEKKNPYQEDVSVGELRRKDKEPLLTTRLKYQFSGGKLSFQPYQPFIVESDSLLEKKLFPVFFREGVSPRPLAPIKKTGISMTVLGIGLIIAGAALLGSGVLAGLGTGLLVAGIAVLFGGSGLIGYSSNEMKKKGLTEGETQALKEVFDAGSSLGRGPPQHVNVVTVEPTVPPDAAPSAGTPVAADAPSRPPSPSR